MNNFMSFSFSHLLRLAKTFFYPKKHSDKSRKEHGLWNWIDMVSAFGLPVTSCVTLN